MGGEQQGRRPVAPLRAPAGAFGVFGVFWGSWAVAAANVERSAGLSPATLGALLSGSVAAGGLAAAAVGGVAERIGHRRTLRAALAVWGATALAAAAVPRTAPFLALFALSMSTAGLVDMAMNASATVGLAGDAGRMVRFHALFNSGALVGAALTGGLIAAHKPWQWAWAVVGVGALTMAALTRSEPPPAGAADAAPPAAATVGAPDASGPPPSSSSILHAWRSVRAERLALLAIAFATTAVVEGGIDTWGVLYLRTHLAAGVLLGAGAYAIGQVIAASTRGAGGPLIGRMHARHGLALGAAIAAIGLGLEASSGVAPVAAVGLVLAAGGISLCWPLVMARLGSLGAAGPDGERPSAAALVGGFTAAGYLGWVVGPAAVGWLAGAAGLAAGLALLASLAGAAALVVAAIPGATGPR